MSNPVFGWESLLRTDAPAACPLKAALLTTYEPADERFLAEHLLPLILKLGRELESEGRDRQYALLELDGRLKQLHDRIVVVSSAVRDEPGEAIRGECGPYCWIWRSIRALTVGRNRRAVQHAKLWLFHWGAEDESDPEFLEIVVSSANLTRAAFKDQIQAAWRACIELEPKPTVSRLHAWGVLPGFLRELAASSGDDSHFLPFLDLLGRAKCPEGVKVVASVPGQHSRQTLQQTPWGAAGLSRSLPPGRGEASVSILSPFVGSWSPESLDSWCSRSGLPANRLELVWIDKDHPWARAGRWILPKSTLKTLTTAGATILRLAYDPDDGDSTDRFHDDHVPSDGRWNHAKIYAMRRGNSRRLLVTSANFSSAAWGKGGRDGELAIENFELGVCVERARWPELEDLSEFEDTQNVAAASALPSRGYNLIGWAKAAWNGRQILVECRCEAMQGLTGEVHGGGKPKPIRKWITIAKGRLHTARIPWAKAAEPPSFVQLTCERETMSVVVFDDRPLADRASSLPPEVGEDVAQEMRDELLFEQYGGRVPEDVEEQKPTGDGHVGETSPPAATEKQPSGDDPGEGRKGGHRNSDCYAVQTFVLARKHLSVVDNWARRVGAVTRGGTLEFERRVLKRDGELLVAAFQRQADRDSKADPARAVGARLAAEELALRLKRFPEVRSC